MEISRLGWPSMGSVGGKAALNYPEREGSFFFNVVSLQSFTAQVKFSKTYRASLPALDQPLEFFFLLLQGKDTSPLHFKNCLPIYSLVPLKESRTKKLSKEKHKSQVPVKFP